MKFSFALAAALFLPVLVNAQSNVPSTNRAPTPTAPASPPASASPTVPAPTPTVAASPAAPTAPASATATTPVSSVSPSASASATTTTPVSSVSPSVPGDSTTNGSINSTSSQVSTNSTTTMPANSTSSQVSTNTTTTASSGSFSAKVNANFTAPGSTNSASPKATPKTTTTKAASSPSPKAQPKTTTARSGGPSPPPAPAPTPTCPSTDTCVQVSPNNQNTYDPSTFGANNGTVVTFIFPPDSDPNSVTQGDFDNPCVYLTAAGGNPGGFDSGLQNGKLFSIRITDDQQPIFFFSKLGKVCGQGMVGAINPPPVGRTYNAYFDSAKALGPNQNTISDSGPVLDGVGAEPEGTPSAIPTPPTSSSSHLVPNGSFALLAALFGITLA